MIYKGIKIGIIGGNGKMGRWFRNFFEVKGYNCLISDVDTSLSNIDIASSCNFIMIATPMEIFEDVVREIAPHIPQNAFLTDICSLKSNQVKCMLKFTDCAVAGTHPLFGPYENHMKRLRVAICPGRGDEWLNWWENFLRENAIFTIRINPEIHDKYMSFIQALNHMILLSLGKTINNENLDPEILNSLSTPSFERQIEIMLRLIPQDPKLYTRIQMDNPYTFETLQKFSNNFQSLMDLIFTKNERDFINNFYSVQENSRKFLKK